MAFSYHLQSTKQSIHTTQKSRQDVITLLSNHQPNVLALDSSSSILSICNGAPRFNCIFIRTPSAYEWTQKLNCTCSWGENCRKGRHAQSKIPGNNRGNLSYHEVIGCLGITCWYQLWRMQFPMAMQRYHRFKDSTEHIINTFCSLFIDQRWDWTGQ